MIQGSFENQGKHFETGATAEEGGMSSESSKKPFFTKNVIIKIVVVIVFALVGDMISVHMAGRGVGDKSKNQQPLISKNERSFISKKRSGVDRIFFVVRAGSMDEIQSILADKTELLTHGKFRNNHIFPEFSTNNEVQLVVFNVTMQGQVRIVLHNWNSDSSEVLDSIGMTPALSVDGNQIVFINGGNRERTNLKIVSKNGDVLKEVYLAEDFARVNSPFFTHDGNSLLFLLTNDNSASISKINIDDNEQVEKICDMDSAKVNFLVSPVSDKIIYHYKIFESRTAKFSLVDFNDMRDIKTHLIEIEIEGTQKLDLLSWSSDGKCVYMHKIKDGSRSIVKLDLESEEIIEIYEIPDKNEG